MGFEVWIVIVLAASGLSGWIGYAYARKGAPKQSELDALAAELEEARGAHESVQSNVNEHFEQSALLFGKLAADYREFLDHFSSSAQSLGLSESRARELIEQGFQPLLTHEGETVEAEGATSKAATASAEEAEAVAEVSDVTVEMPEDVQQQAETETETDELADASTAQPTEKDPDAATDDQLDSKDGTVTEGSTVTGTAGADVEAGQGSEEDQKRSA